MKAKPEYVHNTVQRSGLTGRFYFVPKARVIEEGDETVRLRVVGAKFDITDQIAPYLLSKYKPVKANTP